MVPLSHWTHQAGIMLVCAALIALMWLLIHWVDFERHDQDLNKLS
jgi:hypothetical protein